MSQGCSSGPSPAFSTSRLCQAPRLTGSQGSFTCCTTEMDTPRCCHTHEEIVGAGTYTGRLRALSHREVLWPLAHTGKLLLRCTIPGRFQGSLLVPDSDAGAKEKPPIEEQWTQGPPHGSSQANIQSWMAPGRVMDIGGALQGERGAVLVHKLGSVSISAAQIYSRLRTAEQLTWPAQLTWRWACPCLVSYTRGMGSQGRASR